MKTFKKVRKFIALTVILIVPSFVIAFIAVTVGMIGILFLTYDHSRHLQPVNLDLYRNYQYGTLYLLTALLELFLVVKFALPKLKSH